MRQGLSLFVVVSVSFAVAMSRKRVRYTFDIHFSSQEEKAAFVCRLKRIRELLSPEDGPCPPLDNCMMMNMFFDTALKEDNLSTPESNVEPSVRSLLRNNGEHVYCVVSIYCV